VLRSSPTSLMMLLAVPLGAGAAAPRRAPQAKDMILLGQEGASRSATTRSLTLAGNYLYASDVSAFLNCMRGPGVPGGCRESAPR
jgi:hypothetical protein